MKSVFQSFDKRLKNRKNPPSDAKEANNLTASWASPGTGKSFFLDQCAKLNKEDLDKWKSEMSVDTYQMLSNSMSITVTYNAGTDANQFIHEKYGKVEDYFYHRLFFR